MAYLPCQLQSAPANCAVIKRVENSQPFTSFLNLSQTVDSNGVRYYCLFYFKIAINQSLSRQPALEIRTQSFGQKYASKRGPQARRQGATTKRRSFVSVESTISKWRCTWIDEEKGIRMHNPWAWHPYSVKHHTTT